MLAEKSDGVNRRESFRIDDTVILKVRILDSESLESIDADFNGFRLRYCVKSHIQNQKDVRRPKLLRIKKTNADVAEYLESLEHQIAQLAERLDQVSGSSGDSVEFSDRANLSATGISFHTDLPIEVGQSIEIGMMLNTSNTHVVMVGEVLRVEKDQDNKKAISVRYSHIHPEDTEAVIRHLAKLQQLELSSRRGPDPFS